VGSWHETSMHYFSYLGVTSTDFTKFASGHVMLNLFFLHPVRFVGNVVHSDACGTWNIEALFFMLGWNRYGLNKRHTRTRYAKHVFLHLVGSAGHAVHSGASGARKVGKLVVMLGWDRYGFNKKRVGTSRPKRVFLHPVSVTPTFYRNKIFVQIGVHIKL
jgi:hypothetical protein